MKQQVTDTEGELGVFPKPVRMELFDNVKQLGLQGIEGDHVVMIDIVLFLLGTADDIQVVRGTVVEKVAVFPADPEDKSAIGHVRIRTEDMMGHFRRNHDHIAGLELMRLAVDDHGNFSVQKEIKFVIIVSVVLHTGKMGIIIIIKLKIPGHHILSGAECSL